MILVNACSLNDGNFHCVYITQHDANKSKIVVSHNRILVDPPKSKDNNVMAAIEEGIIIRIILTETTVMLYIIFR